MRAMRVARYIRLVRVLRMGKVPGVVRAIMEGAVEDMQIAALNIIMLECN